MRACTEANYITERAGKASGKPSGAAELAWGAVIGGGTFSLVAAATSPAPAREEGRRCPRFSTLEVSVS